MKRSCQATYEEKLSAVRCYQICQSYRKVASVFNVSHTTISNWVKECRPRKTYESSIRGLKAKFAENIAYESVIKNPLETLSNLGDIIKYNCNIDISKSYISKLLSNKSITRKKVRFYGHPKDLMKKTKAFIERRDQLIAENRKFYSLDETSFGRHQGPVFGYSPTRV
jgi:transposase